MILEPKQASLNKQSAGDSNKLIAIINKTQKQSMMPTGFLDETNQLQRQEITRILSQQILNYRPLAPPGEETKDIECPPV